MSIPLDRLYHYINDIAEQVRSDYVLIYRFYPHGSKNIEDLDLLDDKNDREVICYPIYPQIYCNDQEQLDYDFYQSSTWTITKNSFEKNHGITLTTIPLQNLRIDPSNVYDKCLLLHSERRSLNVRKYKDSHFIPVYYWAHAIIALDWFRYAKHVNIKHNTIQKQFLIYNRAWAGTREYRLKFVELLQKHNLVDDCQTSFNPVDPGHNVEYTTHIFKNIAFKPDCIQDTFPVTTAPSHSSADFTIEDYANTKFEVVLETLFDDERIQLTEKILRPIACGHPFILASTKGSLEYLREYGFKTFDGIIDETYDTEEDPVKRLHLIIDAMKTITTWTEEEQILNWAKINEITKYNKQHFFSDEFANSVVNELKYNVRSAFAELEETNTGKTYFEFRREVRKIPGVWKNIRESKKTNIPGAVNVLRKARSYYKRYLKSLIA
jgi:hypothetical protein